LRTTAARQDLEQVGVGHHAGESVAAQQDAISRRDLHLDEVGGDVALSAQHAGYDVAVRMDGRLSGSQFTAAHHLSHPGMILGQLIEVALVQQIGARIAHVRQRQSTILDQRRSQGGTHAHEVIFAGPAVDDSPVGAVYGLVQVVFGGRLGVQAQ
jgi:hypothetical protein